jgi:damage-control phosphatase, subfamily I
MRTYVECLVCFMGNALSMAKRSNLDEAGQREVLLAVAERLSGFPFNAKPPEMARTIQTLIRNMTGIDDPFEKEKRESNYRALKLKTTIEEKIGESEDPLLSAIEYAIAGNSIDFGTDKELDIEDTLRSLVVEETAHSKNESPDFFLYDELRDALKKANTLLYIADNAGEFVFDFILLRIIKSIYEKIDITVAVRDCPALNDVTLEDAEQIGMNKEFRVISSGNDVPGTIVEESCEEFRKRFFSADTIIAKGQGNYETLSDSARPVFLLLKSKCEVIARHTGSRLGDILLLKGGRTNV